MYKTIITITDSDGYFSEKLKIMLKEINYNIIIKEFEYDLRNNNIIYAVYEIETFNNIRNILTKKLSNKFKIYPIEIYKLIYWKQKRKDNKYFLLSKLKNKNYFSLRTVYTSKVNQNILW